MDRFRGYFPSGMLSCSRPVQFSGWRLLRALEPALGLDVHAVLDADRHARFGFEMEIRALIGRCRQD